ncbi:MAG: hypothetical protein ACRD50_13400 [Candidatus Acidiferrales bacterium]
MTPSNGTAARIKGQRRSKRLQLEVPLQVYSRLADGTPVRGDSQTLNVNLFGALITLNFAVHVGQTLILTNARTQEERECRVVFVGRERRGIREVGVEFPHPADQFWHVYFPVPGQKPYRRLNR